MPNANRNRILASLVLVFILLTGAAASANNIEPTSVPITNGFKTMNALSEPDADISMIAAGYFHTCALKNGAVFCWGSNAGGQLGTRDSSVTQSNLPVKAMSAGVKEISAGGAHTCALLDVGTVYCWGSNFDGQSGSPITVTAIYTPTIVEGFFNVDSISAGTDHTCAIKNGGAKCWGANDSGQLGDGEVVNSGSFNNKTHIPTDVIGMSSGVTQISAGNGFTCAVQNGGAKCWGGNSSGELGAGFVTTPYGLSIPQEVVGLTSGVAQVSAGTSHACAVTTAGGAKCWGANLSGQGGNGSTGSNLIASDVLGLTSGVQHIVAAGSHTCALTTSAMAKCWGGNAGGYLGDGTIDQSNSPVDPVGLASGVTSISAPPFNSHTCVVQNNRPKCWGANSSGELGDNTKTDSNVPVSLYIQTPRLVPLKNITNGTAGTTKDTNNIYHRWKALPLVTSYQIDTKVNDGDWTPLTFIDGDALRKEFVQKNIPASVSCYRIRAWMGVETGAWSQPKCITLNAESQYIDLSISLYADLTFGGKQPYEDTIDYFADGIYEMSNGAHQIRNVYFFLDGAQKSNADVIWNKQEWPRASKLSGYHYASGRMWMADVYPFPGSPFFALEAQNLKGAGYTFAHEFGHYFYGVHDEYKKDSTNTEISPIDDQIFYRSAPFYQPYYIRDDQYIAKAGYYLKKVGSSWQLIPEGQTVGITLDPSHTPTASDNYTIRDDKYVANKGFEVVKENGKWKWNRKYESVQNSIMSSQWTAANNPDSLAWLNFSTALNNNKYSNDQFRTYQASSWDTLSRKASKDPKFPGNFKRVYMPEIAAVAPAAGKTPAIEIPSDKSREKINIVWIEPTEERGFSQAADESDFYAIVESPYGQSLEYPQPAVVVAHIFGNNPIARATVTTTVTKPDGLQATILLKDDGVAPDEIAEDGEYVGYLEYDQDGEYLVEVIFENKNEEAGETDAGFPTVAPNGDTRPSFFNIVETQFVEEASTIIEISGFTADDHDNSATGGTAMTADDADIFGRIDYAGDVDVFEITPTQTDKLTIWLYQLGLGMEADIRFYAADGTSLINFGQFTPTPEIPVYEKELDATQNEKIYVEIRHKSSDATKGLYTISAGQGLEEEVSPPDPDTAVYLPFIRR